MNESPSLIPLSSLPEVRASAKEQYLSFIPFAIFIVLVIAINASMWLIPPVESGLQGGIFGSANVLALVLLWIAVLVSGQLRGNRVRRQAEQGDILMSPEAVIAMPAIHSSQPILGISLRADDIAFFEGQRMVARCAWSEIVEVSVVPTKYRIYRFPSVRIETKTSEITLLAIGNLGIPSGTLALTLVDNIRRFRDE